MSKNPRILPVEEPDAEQRELLGKTLIGPDGRALNIFSTLAHHPGLLKRVNALGGLFMAHGLLTPREREIAILRTAFRAGSDYEWAQHVVLGRRAGLTDNEIARVARPADDEAWGADDRALLHTVDELLATDDLGDATWSGLERRWSTEQILELLLMIGFYRMLAVYLRGVRVQLEPGMETVPGAEGA